MPRCVCPSSTCTCVNDYAYSHMSTDGRGPLMAFFLSHARTTYLRIQRGVVRPFPTCSAIHSPVLFIGQERFSTRFCFPRIAAASSGPFRVNARNGLAEPAKLRSRCCGPRLRDFVLRMTFLTSRCVLPADCWPPRPLRPPWRDDRLACFLLEVRSHGCFIATVGPGDGTWIVGRNTLQGRR